MQVPQQVPPGFRGQDLCRKLGEECSPWRKPWVGCLESRLVGLKPGRYCRPDYNESVKFALREFRHDEFEALWRIDQQCFEPGISYSRLELATYLQRSGAFTLVADAAEVSQTGTLGSIANQGRPLVVPVGFIVAETGSRGTGHIITIDVLPSARGEGAGSQLLQAAEERLRDLHCQSVILETAVDNKPALSFYKRHHYAVIKTLPRYYSNGVDAFVLKKDLLSPPEPAKLPRQQRAQ
jgi:[ribosomal protein S18]-alanine N-acetyltransferase